MNAKSALKFGLLIFLAIAVVTIVRREISGGAAESAANQAILPADGVVAVYFHGSIRCPTCQTIESYAKEAIDTRFAAELADGKLAWRVLNYETPENRHFAEQFEIAAPTVVLIRREAGSDIKGENLARVWELVGDKPAFVDYIARETRSALSSN